MGRTILVLLFSIVIFSSYANAEVIESWVCQESIFGSWDNILVTANVNKGRESGAIAVAGIKYQSKFSIEGFNRRFDFGQDSDGHDYSFIIEPNGDASYYDFSNASKNQRVRASMRLYCKQK